jgi:general stress protein 26
MNSPRHHVRIPVPALLLFCLAACAPAIYAQVKPTPRPDRQTLIATARDIMKTARYCALITLDSSGRPQARTMDPFLPEDNMLVWLATNPKSRKVTEIRRHPNVTLYYFVREDQAYVTISGRARIVSDADAKASHWKDEWKDFYPDRNYLLIAVTPEKLEVVSVKQGIVGDSIKWTPPAVTFGKNKRSVVAP